MNSNYSDFRLISNKFYIAFNLQNRDSVDNYVSGTVGLCFTEKNRFELSLYALKITWVISLSS